MTSPYDMWQMEVYREFTYYDTGRFGNIDAAYLTFPILEPDPWANGDSVAVEPVDMIERLVRVSPNPATNKVKVYSSCGIERVEVYDHAARLVVRQACNEGSAVVDVSAWSSGTYIAKVFTPLGVATKKFIVK